jgi:hypothetical protein
MDGYTKQHVEPESPDDVRRRDRAHLDSRGRQRRTRRDIGGARPVNPSVHGNRADRNGRTDRSTARMEAYATGAIEQSLAPAIVEEILNKPQLYRDRLGLRAWRILDLAYGQNLTNALPEDRSWRGKISDAVVGEMVGRSESTVWRWRHAALTIADELILLWKPANDKWHRIKNGNAKHEELTPEEDAVLTRYSKRTIAPRVAEEAEEAKELERNVQCYRDSQRLQAARRKVPGWQDVVAEASDDVGATGSLVAAQAEWARKMAVADEQALEQAAEARDWKAARLAEWDEETA